MFFQDDFRAWCFAIFSEQAVQQIAPLIVLILIPFLVLSLSSQVGRNSLFYSLAMVFENLGLGLPWNWSNGHSASGHAIHERKKSKKSHPRNRAEQVALNGNAKHGTFFVRLVVFWFAVVLTTFRFRILQGRDCPRNPLPWTYQHFGHILFHELDTAGSV
jgi:hypothetical protein